jgi:hypothetical protein
MIRTFEDFDLTAPPRQELVSGKPYEVDVAGKTMPPQTGSVPWMPIIARDRISDRHRAAGEDR